MSIETARMNAFTRIQGGNRSIEEIARIEGFEEELATLREDFEKFFRKNLKDMGVTKVRELTKAQKAALFALVRDGWDDGKGVNSVGKKGLPATTKKNLPAAPKKEHRKGNPKLMKRAGHALKRHAGKIAKHLVSHVPGLNMLDAISDGRLSNHIENHLNKKFAGAH